MLPWDPLKGVIGAGIFYFVRGTFDMWHRFQAIWPNKKWEMTVSPSSGYFFIHYIGVSGFRDMVYRFPNFWIRSLYRRFDGYPSYRVSTYIVRSFFKPLPTISQFEMRPVLAAFTSYTHQYLLEEYAVAPVRWIMDLPRAGRFFSARLYRHLSPILLMSAARIASVTERGSCATRAPPRGNPAPSPWPDPGFFRGDFINRN